MDKQKRGKKRTNKQKKNQWIFEIPDGISYNIYIYIFLYWLNN